MNGQLDVDTLVYLYYEYIQARRGPARWVLSSKDRKVIEGFHDSMGYFIFQPLGGDNSGTLLGLPLRIDESCSFPFLESALIPEYMEYIT